MPAGCFNCPKCGDYFFFKPFKVYGPSEWFIRACVHCGLPKWEEPPEKTEVYPIPRSDAPRPDTAIAEFIRLRNFLNLVLRDDPRAISLKLDSEGWTNVDLLFAKAERNGVKFTRETLGKLMEGEEKPGFEWNRATQRIRACG